jgi:hypothetical protein
VLWVAVVVWLVYIVTGWSRGFVVLGNFTLLLKLPKMEDHRLAELRKVFVQLYDCLRPFYDQVTMQWSGVQRFYALGNDLNIRYLWSLCLELQEPSTDIW